MKQKKYTFPQSVTRGSNVTVGIVSLSAPEAAMNPDNFKRGVEWLKSKGFRVKIGKHATKKDGFLSGRPADLAKDLHQFLEDSKIDWIVAAGGGYNTNKLLEHLDFELFQKSRKALLGMSNVSILLNALTSRTGVISFHGPAVVWNFGQEGGLDKFTETSLWSMLSHGSNVIPVAPEKTWKWLRKGSCEGNLFGGNLWTLQQLLATPYCPDWRRTILFFEDCFCQFHQIDAILTHFSNAGVFDKLAGLIVGVPEGCEETELVPSPSFEEIVMKTVSKFKFPVLAGVRFGHTAEKMTIPIGARGKLDSKTNTFTILNG
jgi:muramoyltetrapeptide carboxypeptidase